jgi:hypothetical protein
MPSLYSRPPGRTQAYNLTVTDLKYDALAAQTHAGQASWADKFEYACAECRHWGEHKPVERYASGSRLVGQQPKPQHCTKFQRMMGQQGPAIPGSAIACRFFELNPDTPEVLSNNPKRK